jgi:hypothetical protein
MTPEFVPRRLSEGARDLIYRLVEVNDDGDLHGETGADLSGR